VTRARRGDQQPTGPGVAVARAPPRLMRGLSSMGGTCCVPGGRGRASSPGCSRLGVHVLRLCLGVGVGEKPLDLVVPSVPHRARRRPLLSLAPAAALPTCTGPKGYGSKRSGRHSSASPGRCRQRPAFAEKRRGIGPLLCATIAVIRSRKPLPPPRPGRRTGPFFPLLGRESPFITMITSR